MSFNVENYFNQDHGWHSGWVVIVRFLLPKKKKNQSAMSFFFQCLSRSFRNSFDGWACAFNNLTRWDVKNKRFSKDRIHALQSFISLFLFLLVGHLHRIWLISPCFQNVWWDASHPVFLSLTHAAILMVDFFTTLIFISFFLSHTHMWQNMIWLTIHANKLS